MWSQRSTDNSPQLSFIGEYINKFDPQKKIDKGSRRVRLLWGGGMGEQGGGWRKEEGG